MGDLDSILFSYNKAADLNEKYLAEITEYKNHISCLKQQLTTVKEERDSLQLATSLVVKEPKRCNSNNPLPNQNTILINGRQSAFMGNKNSCQINNNPVQNKRFRNTFEPLINEANHVDSELHVEPEIEIIKLDDSCNGSKPVNSRQTTNKHATKPPKNEVACPFLRRRGFCLKGANCDFLHPLNSQLSAQEKRVPSFVPTHPFVPQHVRQDTSYPFLSPNPLICPPYPSRSVPAVHIPVRTPTYASTDETPTSYVHTDKTPCPMSNENDLYNTQSVVMTNPQPVVKFPLKNSNKIPVRITNRSKTITKPRRLPQNLIPNITVKNPLSGIPKLMLTNVMSLTPKIDEVREFIIRNEIDLALADNRNMVKRICI